MRRGIVALAVLIVAAVVLMGWLSELQRKILFPGPYGVTLPILAEVARDVGARELSIATEDGETLYGWHRASADRGAPRALLYFHGNASSVLGQLDLQRRLVADGWDFVEIHYRGYPGSTGVPSEAGVYRDALAAWRWIADELGLSPERVVIHGRSLGGGVAARLASEVAPGALVLESTFTSVSDLAREQFGGLPVGPLLEYRFMTRDLADRIHAPVLVAHGTADSIIDVKHGRRLAELFGADPYIEVPGIDHNEVLLEGAHLDRYFEFLNRAVPRAQP